MSQEVLIRENDRLISLETGEVITTDQEQHAHSKRTLELYGFNVTNPEPFQPFTPEELEPPAWVDWHYTGVEALYGTDGAKRYYRYGFPTGKTQRITSLNERTTATNYARIHGAAKAGRKYGIPAATIRQWTRRSA